MVNCNVKKPKIYSFRFSKRGERFTGGVLLHDDYRASGRLIHRKALGASDIFEAQSRLASFNESHGTNVRLISPRTAYFARQTELASFSFFTNMGVVHRDGRKPLGTEVRFLYNSHGDSYPDKCEYRFLIPPQYRDASTLVFDFDACRIKNQNDVFVLEAPPENLHRIDGFIEFVTSPPKVRRESRLVRDAKTMLLRFSQSPSTVSVCEPPPHRIELEEDFLFNMRGLSQTGTFIGALLCDSSFESGLISYRLLPFHSSIETLLVVEVPEPGLALFHDIMYEDMVGFLHSQLDLLGRGFDKFTNFMGDPVDPRVKAALGVVSSILPPVATPDDK